MNITIKYVFVSISMLCGFTGNSQAASGWARAWGFFNRNKAVIAKISPLYACGALGIYAGHSQDKATHHTPLLGSKQEATSCNSTSIRIGFSGNTIEMLPNRTSPAWDIHRETGEKVVNLAQNNPLGLLTYLSEYRKKFDAAHPELTDEAWYDKINTKLIHDIQHKIAQRSAHPLSLMYECQECGLSRVRNPLARATFDNDVAAALVQKAKTNNGKITYVDIGSGGLFQIATTLAQTLRAHKVNELSIHIIDPSYGRFIEDSQDAEGSFPRDDNFYLNKYKFDPSVTTEQEQKAALLSTHLDDSNTYNRLQQLAAWCHFLAPHTKCRIFVHNQSSDYKKGVQQGKFSAADVITFADPDPNFPYHISQQFCQLLHQSAKNSKLNPPVGLGLFSEHYTHEGAHPEDNEQGRIVVAHLWKKETDNPRSQKSDPEKDHKLVWQPSPYLPLFYIQNFSEGYVPRTETARRYTLEKGVGGYKLATKLFEDQGLA